MCMKSVEVWLYTFLILFGGFDSAGLSPHPWVTNVLSSSNRNPSGAQSRSKRSGGEKNFTARRQLNSKYNDITEGCDLTATEHFCVVCSIAAKYSVGSWHSPVWINCFHN